MAICPFHLKSDGSQETHGSFAMNLSKGLFFCHSCHSKGNLFTFLRDMGVSRDVIEREYRLVIDGACENIPTRDSDPLRPLVFDLMPLEEAVLGLMEYCPFDLVDEGFYPATLRHFEVGFDRWHDRVTYPLRDLKGKLIGISGRNRGDQKPKYKVYTNEYEVWGIAPRVSPDKRALMWNSDKVYPGVYFARPDQNIVVVVEGFKACMWVWQAGIKNVVALMGTYLSSDHQWILERLGAPVYLFLDNNEPGKIGTIDTGSILTSSLDVHVVNYPTRLIEAEEAQPDSCTPSEVRTQVANAPTYLNWLTQFV